MIFLLHSVGCRYGTSFALYCFVFQRLNTFVRCTMKNKNQRNKESTKDSIFFFNLNLYLATYSNGENLYFKSII